MATITSADNGTRLEFIPNGDFILSVTGGTTIAAVLQFKDSEGAWEDVPDATATIAADYMQDIKAQSQREYAVSVTTATGTWAWAWTKRAL